MSELSVWIRIEKVACNIIKENGLRSKLTSCESSLTCFVTCVTVENHYITLFFSIHDGSPNTMG
jgi:hypothetical protein